MKILSIITNILVLVLLFGCNGAVGECNEDSDAVVKAKGLSSEVLNKLLLDVRKLYDDKNNEQNNIVLPKSIRDLDPEHVRTDGRYRLTLYLKACGFDSKVLLTIDASENEKIDLYWGDYGSPKSGSERLWPEA